MQHKKQVGTGDDILFEAIDLDYWTDGESSQPSVAIVSFRVSPAPVTQEFGWSMGMGDESTNEFKIWRGKSGKVDIPYPQEELTSAGKVPIYFGVDDGEISKAVLADDVFEELKTAIGGGDYEKAKKLVTENLVEEAAE